MRPRLRSWRLQPALVRLHRICVRLHRIFCIPTSVVIVGVFFLAFEQGGGKTRSLLIGINYVGQQGELAGCHNDVSMMKAYIATHVSCCRTCMSIVPSSIYLALPAPHPRIVIHCFLRFPYSCCTHVHRAGYVGQACRTYGGTW